jgi:P27 family predicted phage terminase small subunit
MARPRISNEIKKMQGTYRKDQDHHSMEVDKLNDIPKYPDFLSDKAGEYYQNICAVLIEYDMLTAADNILINQLAIALELNEQAYNEIKAVEPVQTSKTGFHTISGWYSIFDKTSKQIRDLCSSFGFSPAARERLTIKEKKELDDLDRLLLGQ